MKHITIIFIFFSSFCFSQQLDNNFTDNDEVVFNYATEIMSTVKNISTGSFLYFEGAGGCGSTQNPCHVQPFQPFSLFWGVNNVQSCTASNSVNHVSFNGLVDPLGGGTGDYSKLIAGGLSANQLQNDVIFTLNCPIVSIKNYVFNLVSIDVISIKVPAKTNVIIKVIKGNTFILYINEIDVFNKNIKDNNFKHLGNNVWFNSIDVVNKEDIDKLNLVINHDELIDNLDHDKTWLIMSKTNPINDNKATINEDGKCDDLNVQPQVNLTTESIMRANIKNECIFEADKEYFLTKVFLKQV